MSPAPPLAVLTALGRTVGGRYYKRTSHVPIGEVASITALVGVYVLLTSDRIVVHLGQAARRGGVAARVIEQLRVPERAALTRSVVVVELDVQTPMHALSAIEGQLALSLSLPRLLPGRRWPRVANWPEAVRTAPHPADAFGSGAGRSAPGFQ